MALRASITTQLIRLCTAAVAGLTVCAALAVAGSADSPSDSVRGAATYVLPVVADSSVGPHATGTLHVAFSAQSGPAGESPTGMMNFQPNAQREADDPFEGGQDLGTVAITCLNVSGNQAFMTGTLSTPISTNLYPNLPPNEWIVGASLHVVDNGGPGSDQIAGGYFVNTDEHHVITPTRCYGSFSPSLFTVAQGQVNVFDATA
jgi:hypothetical protein